MPPRPVKVTVGDTAGSDEATAGTVVHIHVQEASSLAYLVHGLGAARLAGHKSCTPVRRAVGCCAQELRVLGAAQILLGLVCAALGLTLCFAVDTEEYWKASPFWTAAMFVVSGTFSILCRKYEAGCWVLLTAFLALASMVVAVVAMVISVQGIQRHWWYSSMYMCDPKVTSAPGEVTWRQEECYRYLASLLDREETAVGTEPLVISVPAAQAQPGEEMHVDSA
ncbi:transmembrane protein 176A-like isoform X3 [Alligator sinensis]|uniref:Transmembrane protein 176A-like isoform X3 n=1 Tax=Alligator sinensis TaxID=38654 RepID=A0A3Q0FWU8_ALLSI|nr:transmembrane protein 176A-like isoform X3 [Alligator sinensis]